MTGRFKEVKDAIEQLPSDSPVRKLILLKPDDLPLADGLPECKIWLQMIYAELKKPGV